MSLIVADRVQETTNTTGTGAYILGGASPGFQAFSVVTSNADTVYYSITDNVDFEVGLGTYASSGNLISRTTVFSSSNSNNAVNWGVGTKNIFLTYPADKAVIEDVSNNVTIGNNLVVGGTVDGVDIQTLNTTANAALPKAGGTMSGNLILNADPTIALQSATKQYVDTIAAAGIHYHQACRAETTANLNATYSNGSSGVGATLTNAGTQAAIVLDGVTLSATNRVMVQDQTNQAHNGVYTVTTVGSASTNWVLTRATDADSYSPSDPDALGEGDAFFITEGTVHGGELDVMTTTGVITFGTTNIVFALVSDAPIYTAGTGLSISGTEFSLVTPVTSATALATARTIGMTGDVVWTSASFDGTGNVTGTATIQANSVALGTDTTGNYVGAGATSGTGISGSLSAEGGTFTVASNATNANTASTIVARDGSGNFSAGTVTGALSGNASTATALATGRTISLTGDVAGISGSFDGSGNVSIAATIQANSVALGTDTTGNYVASIANGAFLTGGGSSSENKAYTLGVDATSANTASKIVSRDSASNFSAGTVTAALSGNASTATQLAIARNINGVAFDGTTGITIADSTKLPKAGGAMTGAITTNSTFDGRDVSVDGTKLDTIATNANNYTLPAGPAYIDVATGTYGTVKVDDDRSVTYAGYAIRDDWVFMSSTASAAGIFNDTNDEWAILCRQNAETELYYNGIMAMETTGSGIRVGSTTSSDIYMSDTNEGDRRIHCNSNQIGFLNSSNGWSAYSTDAGLWACASGLSVAGDATFTGGAGAISVAANSDIRFTTGTWTGEYSGKIQYHSNSFYIQASNWHFRNSGGTNVMVVDASGNMSISGTVDGVDIAARNGVLTSTTTTANAALPKAGGTLTGAIDINTSVSQKIILQGSADPYIRFREGTTDKAYIQWQNDGYIMFRNQEGGGFRFRGAGSTTAIKLQFEASDGDLYGSVYANHDNDIGFLDDDNHWMYRATTDSQHEWRINNGVEMSLTTSTLDMKGNTITEVEDIGLRDRLYHDGDTDTYLEFDDNQINLTVGGSSEIYVNTTGVRLGDSGNGYFQPVSGSYGSIQIDGGAHNGWEGYSIGGRSVFMHDNSTATGIFNDVDNEWFFYGLRNSYTAMYYNGSAKIVTTNTGVTVTGDLNSTSDIRYKKNIETIDGALDKVKALKGVTFEWDNDAFKEDESTKKPNFTRRATGVIAQDVEKVLPEAVCENEDGMKNVAYGNMVGLLIEAIKEQQVQIDELKAQLNG